MGRVALRVVATGEISAFLLPDYKLFNHKTKKSLSFNLIVYIYKKKSFLEKVFIPTTSQHPHQLFYSWVWTRNGSCYSYCNEFYVLLVFLIFLRFKQGVRTLLEPPLVMPASIAPTRAANKVRNLNVLQWSNPWPTGI